MMKYHIIYSIIDHYLILFYIDLKTHYIVTTLSFVTEAIELLQNQEQLKYQVNIVNTFMELLKSIYNGLLSQVHFRDWESRQLLDKDHRLNYGHFSYRQQLREQTETVQYMYNLVKEYQT